MRPRSNASSTIPALRRRLGANGRERVREHFGLEAFQQAHVDVYRRELARRAVRRLAVAQAAVGAAQRQGRVVAAADLGAEVEQAVARVDLPAAKREAIRVRMVDARLARDGDAVPGIGDEPAFALAEQAGRIGERRDATPEPLSSSTFELRDLGPRAVVVDEQQVGVRDRVRLELERALAVELDDLRPSSSSGGWPLHQANVNRPSVTPVVTNTVARKPRSREHAEGVLGDVEEAVVEVEADRARRDRPRARGGGPASRMFDDAVPLGGQVVHLLAEAARRHRELVAVVGDAVVEEDP